jgi:hypothetical protein
MRRFAASFVLLGFLLSNTVAWAGKGEVCKVLPQFLDARGRQSLSVSLYERDAYQFYLRRHPGLRKTLRVMVEYRASGLDWSKTKMRAELRGLLTNAVQNVTLEQPIKKSGLFGGWASFDVAGPAYKKFGELTAWRITLWEGDKQLSEQESFLWSGVVPASLH